MMPNKDPLQYIQYLENMLFLMPGHVYWLDINNIYLGCNYLQAKSFGLNSPDEVIGKTNSELIIDRVEAAGVNAINKEVMQTKAARTIEEKVALVNGERVYLSHKYPLFDNHGEVVGMFGVSFDITEEKKKEEEINKARDKAKMAESANLIKNEFICNMEHDIRTPVAGILGLNKHLKSLEADPFKKELLNDIENASQELMNYFTDILEFTHIEAGGLPVLLKRFDLKELMTGIWDMEMPAAKSKNLELILHCEENIPTTLIGDKFRVQRILINLVSNAIKFTKTGYVKIKASLAKMYNQRNAIVTISVEDTGNGISEEKQNFLFEKFNRGEPANKGIQKGIGLGLRIVKQFINELGGEIEVYSETNRGTQFICIIPFQIPWLDSLTQE